MKREHLDVFDALKPSVEQLLAFCETRLRRRSRDREHRLSDGGCLLWAELPLVERDEIAAEEAVCVAYRL